MFNQEILDKIITQYGPFKAMEFCEILSTFYDIKYNACKTPECQEEYDYERDWWNEASNTLKQKQFSNS